MLCCPLGWRGTSLRIEMREAEGQRQQVNDPEMCSGEAKAAEQGGRVRGRPGSGVQAPGRVGQPGRVRPQVGANGPLSGVGGQAAHSYALLTLCTCPLPHGVWVRPPSDSLPPGAKLLPVFHTLPHVWPSPCPPLGAVPALSLVWRNVLQVIDMDPSLWSRVNPSSRRGVLLLGCLSHTEALHSRKACPSSF